jgi:hypothetical protein
MSDGKAAGLTPTREVHLADGSTVDYLFHLDGFVDVQVPISLASGGERTVHVDLRPALAAPSARRSAPARTSRRATPPSADASAKPTRTPAAPPPTAPPAAPPADPGWDDPARPLLPATRVRHLGQR